MSKKPTVSRREFLKTTGAAVATATLVPRHAVAGSGETSPSEKINIAGIGVGGMGGNDVHAVAGGNNIVALCDVDRSHAAHLFKDFPGAKRYKDFRKMLDEADKQIDAVVVGTPDHNHAVTSIAAMKRGKHVYCEKPLAHSVFECREMARVAKENAGRHADGQPGPLVRVMPGVVRMDLGRRDRQGPHDRLRMCGGELGRG